MNLLMLHASCTLFLAGLIWFVQVVHYPLFNRVGADAFPVYERDHSRLTTLVVTVPMLLELASGLWLVVFRPPGLGPLLPWAGILLLAVIWLSTAFLQVPAHRQLSRGFQESAYRRLTGTNWIRTAAWSLRVPLVLLMLGVS